ncbi:hypothetical protein MMC07_004970 [Pseudocyphellaria aurata]|nr:hypothetical protein [Pseudocyphellaria aurata]
MAKLLDDKARHRTWTGPFLRLSYQQFNVPGVSLDQGSVSVPGAVLFCGRLETAPGHGLDSNRFLELYPPTRHETTRRIQLIVLWVLQNQGHVSPTTFRTFRLEEPLATAASGPNVKLPEFVAKKSLLSMLCGLRHPRKNLIVLILIIHLLVLMVPVFWTLRSDAVRKMREEHLKEVNRISEKFNDQLNGLPELTPAPTSDPNHYNLRIRQPTPLPFPKETILTRNVEVLTEFVAEVRYEIFMRSHRGKLYQDLQTNIRRVRPSVWQALRVAGKKLALEKHGNDESGVSSVHN